MSFLIDTKLISLCHKKHLPAKFKAWLRKNEADSFINSVTIAEMRYGVELADATHQPLLSQRVARTEVISPRPSSRWTPIVCSSGSGFSRS